MTKILYWINLNKFKSGFIGLFLILIFSNPSPSRFRSFIGENTSNELSQKYYFLVLSIYNDKESNLYYEKNKTYIAFLGNFILIKEDSHSKFSQ